MKNIKNIIDAGALGDSFGYPVEFLSYKKIKEIYGEQGILEFKENNNKITVSDDTQMTLFTLNAVIEINNEHGDLNNTEALLSFKNTLINNYVDWLETQNNVKPEVMDGLLKFRSLYKRRAPGNTCLSAISKLKDDTEYMPTVNHPINDSKGCGGIMRVAPIIFLNQKLSSEQLFIWGCESALITHGHPFGYLSSGSFLYILNETQKGNDLKTTYENLIKFLNSPDIKKENYPDVKLFVDYLKNKKDFVFSEFKVETMEENLGGGWVGEEALLIAIHCVVNSQNFNDVLKISSNHSGDSDSTASLASQLWVANPNATFEMNDQVEALDVKDAMDFLYNKLTPINTLKLK